MTEETKARLQMQELKHALGADEVRFVLTWAISLSGPKLGDGLRVEYKDYGQKRWTTVKTAIFPDETQSTADVFETLYDMRVTERAKRESRL